MFSFVFPDYNHHSSASNLFSHTHVDQSSPINGTLPHLTPSRHGQINKSITFNNNATRNLLSTFSEVGKHLENPQPLPDQPVGQEARVHASSSSRVDVVDIPLSNAFEPQPNDDLCSTDEDTDSDYNPFEYPGNHI
jgi:hypothetical protein